LNMKLHDREDIRNSLWWSTMNNQLMLPLRRMVWVFWILNYFYDKIYTIFLIRFWYEWINFIFRKIEEGNRFLLLNPRQHLWSFDVHLDVIDFLSLGRLKEVIIICWLNDNLHEYGSVIFYILERMQLRVKGQICNRI
jgi:hypothetical protein